MGFGDDKNIMEGMVKFEERMGLLNDWCHSNKEAIESGKPDVLEKKAFEKFFEEYYQGRLDEVREKGEIKEKIFSEFEKNDNYLKRQMLQVINDAKTKIAEAIEKDEMDAKLLSAVIKIYNDPITQIVINEVSKSVKPEIQKIINSEYDKAKDSLFGKKADDVISVRSVFDEIEEKVQPDIDNLFLKAVAEFEGLIEFVVEREKLKEIDFLAEEVEKLDFNLRFRDIARKRAEKKQRRINVIKRIDTSLNILAVRLSEKIEGIDKIKLKLKKLKKEDEDYKQKHEEIEEELKIAEYEKEQISAKITLTVEERDKIKEEDIKSFFIFRRDIIKKAKKNFKKLEEAKKGYIKEQVKEIKDKMKAMEKTVAFKKYKRVEKNLTKYLLDEIKISFEYEKMTKKERKKLEEDLKDFHKVFSKEESFLEFDKKIKKLHGEKEGVLEKRIFEAYTNLLEHCKYNHDVAGQLRKYEIELKAAKKDKKGIISDKEIKAAKKSIDKLEEAKGIENFSEALKDHVNQLRGVAKSITKKTKSHKIPTGKSKEGLDSIKEHLEGIVEEYNYYEPMQTKKKFKRALDRAMVPVIEVVVFINENFAFLYEDIDIKEFIKDTLIGIGDSLKSDSDVKNFLVGLLGNIFIECFNNRFDNFIEELTKWGKKILERHKYEAEDPFESIKKMHSSLGEKIRKLEKMSSEVDKKLKEKDSEEILEKLATDGFLNLIFLDCQAVAIDALKKMHNDLPDLPEGLDIKNDIIALLEKIETHDNVSDFFQNPNEILDAFKKIEKKVFENRYECDELSNKQILDNLDRWSEFVGRFLVLEEYADAAFTEKGFLEKYISERMPVKFYEERRALLNLFIKSVYPENEKNLELSKNLEKIEESFSSEINEEIKLLVGRFKSDYTKNFYSFLKNRERLPEYIDAIDKAILKYKEKLESKEDITEEQKRKLKEDVAKWKKFREEVNTINSYADLLAKNERQKLFKIALQHFAKKFLKEKKDEITKKAKKIYGSIVSMYNVRKFIKFIEIKKLEKGEDKKAKEKKKKIKKKKEEEMTEEEKKEELERRIQKMLKNRKYEKLKKIINTTVDGIAIVYFNVHTIKIAVLKKTLPLITEKIAEAAGIGLSQLIPIPFVKDVLSAGLGTLSGALGKKFGELIVTVDDKGTRLILTDERLEKTKADLEEAEMAVTEAIKNILPGRKKVKKAEKPILEYREHLLVINDVMYDDCIKKIKVNYIKMNIEKIGKEFEEPFDSIKRRIERKKSVSNSEQNILLEMEKFSKTFDKLKDISDLNDSDKILEKINELSLSLSRIKKYKNLIESEIKQIKLMEAQINAIKKAVELDIDFQKNRKDITDDTQEVYLKGMNNNSKFLKAVNDFYLEAVLSGKEGASIYDVLGSFDVNEANMARLKVEAAGKKFIKISSDFRGAENIKNLEISGDFLRFKKKLEMHILTVMVNIDFILVPLMKYVLPIGLGAAVSALGGLGGGSIDAAFGGATLGLGAVGGSIAGGAAGTTAGNVLYKLYKWGSGMRKERLIVIQKELAMGELIMNSDNLDNFLIRDEKMKQELLAKETHKAHEVQRQPKSKHELKGSKKGKPMLIKLNSEKKKKREERKQKEDKKFKVKHEEHKKDLKRSTQIRRDTRRPKPVDVS